MRRVSLVLLAIAVVALTAAGLGTAARLGVFQASTAPVGDSSLAADDFYVVVERTLAAGRTLDLYIDVEFYKGPGSYRGAQSLLIIQEAGTLYTWSNFRTEVTVLPREAGVRLARTELRPEAGRPGAGVETLTGTLACGAPRPG